MLALALVVAAVLEVSLGPVTIPFMQVLPKTVAYLRGDHSTAAVVMGAIRWPRLCVAVLVGAGLAATGAVLQAVFRNAMADPGVIGVSAGGSLGAVLVITAGGASVHAWAVPGGAFAAALTAMAVVYRLGTIGGRTAVHTLLLAGVAVGSLCSALVTLVLSLTPLETMQQILFWLMGGLDGSTWMSAAWLAVSVAAGMAIYMAHADALDVMSIGEEQAEGVGVPLQRVKRVLFVTAAVVVGVCVSISGVISFVGLIVPHLVRLWLGPRHRSLVPASALGGAVLVVAADIVARMALRPVELNIGVVTSCLGAPFFLYLLRRHAVSPWRSA